MLRFEDYKMGHPIIATLYHWAESPNHELTMKGIENSSFHLCDTMHTWFTPQVKSQRLFEVECFMHDPLVLLDQFCEYEEMFGADQVLAHACVKYCKFDAIIHTPHVISRGKRQAVLLKPKTQILAIKRVTDFDPELLAKRKESDAVAWTKFMQSHLRQRSTTHHDAA